MKFIYICSPYRGDTARNIENARAYSRAALRMGYFPITPHIYLTQMLDDTNQDDRALALQIGRRLIPYCKEMWVFGLDKPSEGMQGEIDEAHRMGVPVADGFKRIGGT